MPPSVRRKQRYNEKTRAPGTAAFCGGVFAPPAVAGTNRRRIPVSGGTDETDGSGWPRSDGCVGVRAGGRGGGAEQDGQLRQLLARRVDRDGLSRELGLLEHRRR